MNSIKLVQLIFFFAIISQASFAISELNYSQNYIDNVIPFYNNLSFGGFKGVNNITIKYASHIVPSEIEKGAVVIFPGKSESYVKYAELMYDLKDENYSIYILDHRGQGFSNRLIDDRMKFYVDDFNNYVVDAKTFVNEVVEKQPHKKTFLLAHSMGGAIGTLYLERYCEDDDFDAAVFSAPMLEINTNPYPKFIAYLVTAIPSWIGFGESYAVGKGPRVKELFNESTITQSKERYWMWEEYIQEEKYPEITTGGATNNWVKVALSSTKKAVRDAGKIDLPVLLFQAGKDDYVMPDGQDTACARMLDCRKILINDSKHEFFMEKDEIRNEAIQEVKVFFDERLKE